MDSLKTLIAKKQYTLVLELTKDANDVDSLSYRIAAFLGLGKLDEALGLIKKNQSRFNDGLLNIMRVHFEVLLTLRKYDEAYEELTYYKNLPYISQEVEEYLRDAELMIRRHERSQKLDKKLSDEEIATILSKEKDDVVLLSALNELRDRKLATFADDVIRFIKRKDLNSHVSTYALFLLVSAGYDKEITFSKNNRKFTIVPKDLEPPFMDASYDLVCHAMEDTAKDPSVFEVATSLLNELIIILYPENVFGYDNVLLSGAILVLAYDHLRIAYTDEELAKRIGVDVEKLKNLAIDLSGYLRNNPPIKA